MIKFMAVLLTLAFICLFSGYILSFRKSDPASYKKTAETASQETSAEREIPADSPESTFTEPVDEAKLGDEINEDNAYKFLAAGKREIERGNYIEALAYYDAIVLAVPSNARVYSNRAAAKMHMGDYAGAIEDCNTSIKIAPERMNAYVNRAGSRFHMKDYAGAISDADVLISKGSDLENAYALKGYCEYELGNFEKAVENFEKAASINPERKNDGFYKQALAKTRGAR